MEGQECGDDWGDSQDDYLVKILEASESGRNKSCEIKLNVNNSGNDMWTVANVIVSEIHFHFKIACSWTR